MAGVTIQLVGNVDGVGGLETLTVTTSNGTLDSNNDGVTDASDVGFFSFVDLQPGVYVVRELFTDGISWGATVDHNNDGFGDAVTTVTVTSGDELVSQAGLADLIPGQQEVNVGSKLIFGNMELGGCGLSPGFWAQHVYVWDGDSTTNGRNGKTAFDLVSSGKIIESDMMDLFPVFDVNGNGVLESSNKAIIGADEDIDGDQKADLVFQASDGRLLVIEWDDAKEIIDASQTAPNKLADFARMAINAFLNDIGTPNFQNVNGLLADAADWMLQVPGATTGVNTDGDVAIEYYRLNYDNKSNVAGENGVNGFPVNVSANSNLWKFASDSPDASPDLDVPPGTTIFNALAATICNDNASSSADLIVSQCGCFVVLGKQLTDYFSIQAVTHNDTGGYLDLIS
jgi:hypothetical protein